MKTKTTCIIAAAGKGTRLKASIPKQYISIIDIPLIIYTLKNIDKCPDIDNIIVVANKNKIKYLKKITQDFCISKITKIIEGGSSRSKSVWNGLQCVDKNTDIVLIHDGARPNVNNKLLKDIILNTRKYSAVIPVTDVKDTIKLCKRGFVKKTLNREQYCSVQTPQGFKFKTLFNSYKKLYPNINQYTDDSSILEMTGHKIKTIKGCLNNYKITTQEDLIKFKQENFYNTDYKIGIGYDIHKLVKDRKLILGGIKISYHKGLLGHSDGDVLLHAITDAILGSVSNKDIGYFFPPSNAKYKNKNSRFFLKESLKSIPYKYRIIHIDNIIVAEKPKLTPYRNSIINSISSLIDIDKKLISVKFKTAESLGPLGNENGIAALSILLLKIYNN